MRFVLHLATALTLTLVCAHADVGYTVTTFAGAAAAGHDDGNGTSARFYEPSSAALDSQGNVYVADEKNNTIRKITSSGVVSTFAGSAVAPAGFTNDTGGDARFDSPHGIAVDHADNVYVADINNGAIRKITPAGLVTTFASGIGIPTNLAFDVSGNLYVTDAYTKSVLKITPAGISSVFADLSSLVLPSGIAVDALGNVYVSDFLDHTIKKITPAGAVSNFSGFSAVTTPADGASSRYNRPQGIAIDAAGYIYVADNGGHRIRRVDASGQATTIAGLLSPVTSGFIDDSGSAARFNEPAGLAVDGVGTIYVADTKNNSIRKVTRTPVLVISDQPADRSVVVGTPTSFTVTVTGGTGLSYQWRKDGVNIAGATTNVYSIASTLMSDAGNYSVTAYNADGIVTTTPANLTVTGSAAAISAQPASVTQREHTIAIFQAAATGSPAPSYQWQIQQAGESTWTDLANGGRYTGAQTTTLQVSNLTVAADSGDRFRCVATNLLGVSTSNSATLTVQPAVNADFNGDGNADLVLQNLTTGARSVRLMTGSTVISETTLETLSKWWSIVGLADFNGDGQTDLLLQNSQSGERMIRLMNGSTASSDVILGVVPPDWSMVATADFNGDSKPDILWQHSSGARYLWLMNGTTLVQTINLGTVPADWSIVAAADFNGDNKPDILYQHLSGVRYLWFMNGTSLVATADLGFMPPEWSIATAADFNGDSKTDILFQNTVTGQLHVWFMNGSTKIGTADIGSLPPGWSLAGVPVRRSLASTHDFNGDGYADILAQNASGQRYVWFMNGATTLGSASLPTIAPEWSYAATADFNNNGQVDIVLQNLTTGERKIQLMNGTTPAGEVDLGIVPTDWTISAVADFNGDNRMDIFWTHASGARYLWLMNGTSLVGSIDLGNVPPDWTVTAAADFNGDGKPDILWNHTSGARYLWFMDGTSLVSYTELPAVPPDWSVGLVADFNGDDKPDLLWQHTSGARYIWFMNGSTVISTAYIGTVAPDWQVVK